MIKDSLKIMSDEKRPLLSAPLRFGWTTGTCATAATEAAYIALITGIFPHEVHVKTPSGKVAKLPICYQKICGNMAEAGIIKDAGDDPDVTHGAEIRASVRENTLGKGVAFEAGKGVGMVTKSGLPIPAGEPAINPVPRQMMRDAIEKLARELNATSDIIITISVPNGEALAPQTWNPRLGILGGISILGTSGVVRPFSCAAWIASIHRGIDVARANGIDHVAGATGNTSEKTIQKLYDLPESALLDMGDFAAGMLKYMRRHPVARATIAGGFGKMVKLAQGHGDLHSKRSQIDFIRLAETAKKAGFDYGAVAGANSALAVLDMAKDENQKTELARLIADDALIHARDILREDSVSLDIAIIDRSGAILAETKP